MLEVAQVSEMAVEKDDAPEVEADKPAPYEPPSADEWERTTRALAVASAQAKQRKEQLREIEAAKAAAPGPKDEKAIRSALEAELSAQYKAPAVKAAARVALQDAGYQGNPSPRVLAMIDLGDCEISADGDVTGLDQQIREIKKDFPALFAAPAAKPPRVDAAERSAAPGGRKLSSAERIAQQVLQP